MKGRTTAVLLVAVVALGAMTGVAAADGHLEVAVDDGDGGPTVSVTQNDTAVENATVTVSVGDAGNESYDGAGEYETDANGTVDLPAPEEDVTVNVTATAGNETASADEVPLEAPDGLELDVEDTDGEPVVTVTDNGTAAENASVNVTTAEGENVTYVGEGGYETGENGTVTLDAAEDNVTVDVTAEYEGETVSTAADLTTGEGAGNEDAFGLQVRKFIESLEDREGGIGAAVSDFVTESNPGNAPDHAGGPGGPDDAGNESAEDGSDAPGNGNASDRAGQDNDGERGPPDHAGNGDDGDNKGGNGDNEGGNADRGDERDDAGDGSDKRGGNGDADDESGDTDDESGDADDESGDADAEGESEDEGDGDDDENGGNGPGNGNGNGNGPPK